MMKDASESGTKALNVAPRKGPAQGPTGNEPTREIGGRFNQLPLDIEELVNEVLWRVGR